MASAVKTTDDWLAKLSKLVPAEITGLFLAMRGVLIGESKEAYLNYDETIITLCLLVLIVYTLSKRIFGLLHIAIIVVSFYLWVSLIDTEFISNPNYSITPLGFSDFININKYLSSTTNVALINLAWLTILPLLPASIINWYPSIKFRRASNVEITK